MEKRDTERGTTGVLVTWEEPISIRADLKQTEQTSPDDRGWLHIDLSFSRKTFSVTSTWIHHTYLSVYNLSQMQSGSALKKDLR